MFTFLEEIFCHLDDFCKLFEEQGQGFLLSSGTRQRKRRCQMSLSEVMAIMVYFHMSNYRNFKHFYLACVLSGSLKAYFPKAVSYSIFVQLMLHVLFPLVVFMNALGRRQTQTGLYYVDSTVLPVCHIRREKRHKVFAGLAKKGKSSMGWFFGLKLHLVINNLGEIMAATITPGNTNDRTPVPALVSKLQGWLFGDKGYLGQSMPF